MLSKNCVASRTLKNICFYFTGYLIFTCQLEGWSLPSCPQFETFVCFWATAVLPHLPTLRSCVHCKSSLEIVSPPFTHPSTHMWGFLPLISLIFSPLTFGHNKRAFPLFVGGCCRAMAAGSVRVCIWALASQPSARFCISKTSPTHSVYIAV